MSTATGHPASLRAAGILADLRGLLPNLPASVRRTAEHLLADPVGSVSGTITELAQASGTSPSAVSRLCRRLGVEGYPGLRLAVLADVAATTTSPWQVDISSTIAPDDPLDRVARTLATSQARAVHDTLRGLDLDAVHAVAEAVTKAGRVQLYGVSGSAVMSTELQLRLHRIGIPCWSYADVHEGLTGSALLADGDVAIAVSYTGETVETIEMLGAARSSGALAVAITGAPTSPLAEIADHVLTTIADATTFREGPLAARFAELAVVEMLYLAVSQRTYERTSALLARTAQSVSTHQTPRDRRRSRR